MQEWFQRCKHCGSEYIHRINGHRCGMEDYTSDYCPECQSQIDKVIQSIPKHFEPRWKEIDASFINEINEYINGRPYMQPQIDTTKVGVTYGITMQGEQYQATINKDSITLYCYCEFDLFKNEFTNNKWYNWGLKDGVREWRDLSAIDINDNQIQMNEPSGLLSYMSFFLDNEDIE